MCFYSVMGGKLSGSTLWICTKRNAGKNTETPGLSIAHKLKYEHIKLTNFSKMHVDLAAQVIFELRYKHMSHSAFFLIDYEFKCS